MTFVGHASSHGLVLLLLVAGGAVQLVRSQAVTLPSPLKVGLLLPEERPYKNTVCKKVCEDAYQKLKQRLIPFTDIQYVTGLSPIHTADADETKLSSLVASAVCTRIRN